MKATKFRGVLKEGQERKIAVYMSSLKEDVHLFRYELNLLMAHTLSLLRTKVIDEKKAKKILLALMTLRRDKKFLKRLESSSYVGSPEFYDIHPVIEKYLIDRAGMESGGFINLGKSRNDAIVADMRMFMRDNLLTLGERLYELGIGFMEKAERYLYTPFISFTHQQPAQVTTFGYFLLAHCESLVSSTHLMKNIYANLNVSPLGACAISGTSVPLDRRYTAKLLGFGGVIDNAIYATSSRDFVIQSAFPYVLAMNFLSRFSADMLFLSSMGYDYITVPDRLADTSSVMPHKKNLSPMELVRARANEVSSLFNGLNSTLSGRVSGYNQDFQEMKVLWWKIAEITLSSVEVMKEYLASMSLNETNIEKDILRFFVTAIDLAEVLTLEYGIPFREAHHITGRIVARLKEGGRSFEALTSKLVEEETKNVTGKEIQIEEKDLRRVKEVNQNLISKSKFYSKRNLRAICKRCWRELGELIKWVRKEKLRLIKAEEFLLKEVERVIGR